MQAAARQTPQETKMKLNSKIVSGLLATSAFAFGIGAQAAEPAGAGCEEGGPGRMMGDAVARAEQRMSQMKSQLKLTDKQEPLWKAFAEKMQAEMAQGMNAARDKMQQPMSAPERMAQMMSMMRERMTVMESAADSFKRLYDTMTPEQKAIADKQAGMFGGAMPPPRGKSGTPGQAAGTSDKR
jgi:hypothetical protein